MSVLLFASVFASAQSESKVFVTKTGAKYHRATCRYAQKGWEAAITEGMGMDEVGMGGVK